MANATSGTLPADFVGTVGDCTRDAVLGTFASICGAPLSLEANSAPENEGCDGMVAVISLTGPRALSRMVGLPRPTATALSEKFAGFAIDYESADMGDVVGKLAHVVGGDLVAKLDRAGVKTEMGLPTVVRGLNVEMPSQEGVESTLLRLGAPQGGFWVGLAVSGTKK